MFLVDGTFQVLLASNHPRCCLMYSGRVSLDITVAFGSLTLLRVLVGQAEEHSARWRSLTWHALLGEGNSNVLSILPSTLPSLQAVNLFDFDIFDSVFPGCPRLQAVVLHQCDGILLHEVDCERATELALGRESIWNLEDVEVLYKFRNVRRFTLYTVNYIDAIAYSPSEPWVEVLFPRLHSLRLKGELAWVIVRVLKTPVLKEVEFDMVSSSALFEDASLAPTVETVHIRIAKYDAPRSTLEMFKGLLTVVPLLRYITVPKWLSEELESDGLCLEERGVQLRVATK